MRLLVSVRDVAEARIAAAGGADYIDCKEPSAGALGALPLATIRAVVDALPGRVISATVGDLAGNEPLAAVQARVAAVADCGVDLVKVGVLPGQDDLLDALADCDADVVPVFVVDRGFDEALFAEACALPFAALMLDTADKRGSLFDRVPAAMLARAIARARAARKPCGLAGALRFVHLPTLVELGPDFAGFRSAVCAGARTAALDENRLALLRTALAPSPQERAA